MKRLRNKAGFTLLELTISVAVLMVMAKFTIESLRGLQATTTSSSTTVRMQQSAEGALLAIIADMHAAGFVTTGGKDYPHLFDDGVTTDPNFSNHDHTPATHHAVQGDIDFGITREIVFVRPADLDGNEIPDTNQGSGALEFDATEISYVLVTNAQGRNELQRRIDGAAGTAVAVDVERVAFDTAVSAAENLPAESIRVRIWYRGVDENGALLRHMSEATVRLRNG